MSDLLFGEPSHHGSQEGNSKKNHANPEEGAGCWYFSRKEIEENSPSRRDGIDLKKETYLRKSYCTFLQDLGMRLKVPQVTIATAMIFCHRFFLRQSHAKNDRRTVATVCMFLAGKVEETPRPIKDVVLVSYEIIHKKDVAAVQRIKRKEVYDQQKEFILLGECLVLTTLGFDMNVHHPYKPLVEAIKKLEVAQNALAQVAWNFVNDGLRTSLCLQFQPHHIAAGAIFLAAKFLKVKLPCEGQKIWWQEFDVTARQVEEVSNQMLELYEQSRVPTSQASEVEGSTTHVMSYSSLHTSSKAASLKPTAPRADHHSGPSGLTHEKSINCGNSEPNSITGDDQQGKHHTRRNLSHEDGALGQSPCDAPAKKLDKEKIRAAVERRKARGEITQKTDPIDELERELEDVEIPVESEKIIKHESKQNSSEPINKPVDDFDMVVEEGEVKPSGEKTNRNDY